MQIGPGSRLGVYEIVALLGEGGMGAVYRARDTKLGREVAVKVILDAYVADRERLARFEREAKALAALNHTNIATLYGMEEAGGRHFLVMELVDGLTLREQLVRGPMALDVTIGIARQIAEGLEAAHEKGIVHRDLKPANVKVTADDKVKVLDFGLATAGRQEAGDASVSLANSPTLTAMGTQAGVILGTASYMSPEQARGMLTDHRSDIFSFGVVLYEMLTGRQPFQGETVSDVLASVLARDPDLKALPPDLAPRLSELVKRCLDKHPKRRWQAIGDVRHELEQIAANPRNDGAASAVAMTAAALAKPRPLWRRALPFAAAVAATGGLTYAAVTFARPAPPPGQVSRFIINYAEGQQLTIRPGLAISPDGSRIAFVSNRKLQIRELGDFSTRTIATAGQSAPLSIVFSPRSDAVAYLDNVDKAIKQVSIVGAPLATTVCKLTDNPAGLSWSGDYIYFTTPAGIKRAPAAGGQEELVVKKADYDVATRPQLLPDGRFLFSVAQRQAGVADVWSKARVVIQGPDDKQPITVVDGGTDPRYLPGGYLTYVSAGVLYARRFDPARLSVGVGVPVVEGIFRSVSGETGGGLYWYSVSDNGTLVYQPGKVAASGDLIVAIALFDRTGGVEVVKVPIGPYTTPRISPDGRRIAFGVDDGREASISIYDRIAGGSPRRLTFGGRDKFPVWSADSQRVIFQSDREGDLGLYSQAADGSATAIRLTTAGKDIEQVAQSVSPDGSLLLFDEMNGNRVSLKVYSFKDEAVSSYGSIEAPNPTGAVFSPNGRWVAYAGKPNTSGQSVVFVQPYPATGVKYSVSPSDQDGHHAVWSKDGKELFYTPGPGTVFTALTVDTSGTSFSYGQGAAFARVFYNQAPSFQRPFDITKNAKGEPVILGLSTNTTDPTRSEIMEARVVLNWLEELKAKVK